MSNFKGLDIIREAYSKVISQNVEMGNLTESKYLIESLEKLSENLKFTSVSDSTVSDSTLMPSLFDDDMQVNNSYPVDFAVSTDEMRKFVISYITTFGISNADEVADAFEIHFRKQFNALDISVTTRNNSPRWRRRLHSEVSRMRLEGILMPHEHPYCYKYAFTSSYESGSKEISAIF